MKIHLLEQQTEEWYKLKGQYILSSSHAQAIAAGGKGLETLIWEKLAELYSSGEKDRYTNKDMERGNTFEPMARALYEMRTGNKVQEVGFITNEKISKVGGTSTDGLVNDDGVLEIKAFEDKKHFQYMVDGLEIESQYMWQMQMEMLFSERKWCDYCVYNPNFKDSLLITRVFPDKEKQDKIIAGLKVGEEIIKRIKAKIK